ncbi:DUF2268 domain-containing putative Zn-dependent protease [Flavobacterium sp. '19STA2R22 D10 B1']|uniref:gliding motility protein GldB-related protein n=1 Tax=Flavobacterium aerium TaxID=3037261 RepID=UPI00278BE564|nr:DUF2268 domain-containing putative Zn-dependent protease [Flavobacterium sp. '19STA2R22 D10 B1']
MKAFFLILTVLLSTHSFSQKTQKIYTSDIDNFWTAYDSVQQVSDFSKKINLINKLYIDKGTKGLKAFMETRQYNDTLWVELIEKYPKFWNSIRANTLSVKKKTADFEKVIENLKRLYPELKDAEMYFTIGGLRSGGTVKGNMVLIGAEIATGDYLTDVSEFKNNWLKNVFAEQSLDNITSLNIHEYIHTQQNEGKGSMLLNQCISEGSCDFITELVMQNTLQRKYLSYGNEHEKKIKESFKKEMFSSDFSNWLYNGDQKEESADLGYYIGYEICKAYYNQSKDKKKAIKEIIELDYGNTKAVENFLSKFKFYPEKINKKKIIEEYSKNQPFIVEINPSINDNNDVNPDLKELRVTFSKEMMPKNYSISFSEKGKDYFPLTGVKGFENNDKTMVMNVGLKPNKEYEFVITNRSFKSKDGYPLKETTYTIKFKTK